MYNMYNEKSYATNDTVGAVAEMEAIGKSGFLKFSRAAVRLVPRAYSIVLKKLQQHRPFAMTIGCWFTMRLDLV